MLKIPRTPVLLPVLLGMKLDLYSYEWISVEIQSAEMNPRANRVEEFFIVSLKTLFENLNLVKCCDKTNPTGFVFSLSDKYRWGLISFGQYRHSTIPFV